ncbi:MAG: LacI family DNA-binding transcriptional regulator [Oscillospiraceae bacterium]|nr:LacI family DNA-binding transcriptional regulator [Oscillospiraceae bacterium]
MAVTIKDVAMRAGVSTSTVSRVCNGNTATTRETRERVLKAIAELGYEVSPVSESAPQPGTNIAVILPPADRNAYENVFYLKAIRGISQVCNQRGISTAVVAGETFEEILQAVQALHRSKRADGYILLYARENDIVVDYLCSQGLVYVVVGKVVELSNQTICIDNDNLVAGKDAADYLYRLGHRRIGCISERNDYFYSVDRRSGYQLSLLQNGLNLDPGYSVQLHSLHPEDMEELHHLLQREDRPTAFVVCDDILALALERVCAQNGLRIPQDVSIIAFNNSLYAKLSVPQLTSVDINSYQLGYEAAVQVINHVENPDLAAIKTVVPHKILERDSCRNINA